MTDTTLAPTTSPNGTLPPVEVIDVTPDLASLWLTKNHKNRNLREKTAQLYAEDMIAGDWRWTGESIKFAHDGSLIDGQHRLRAVELAGITVPMLVVRGLAPEAQEDVDRGVPRKFYDVLALRGEVSASSLAAIVRRVHGWQKGLRKNLDTGNAATVAQMLRTLEAHPELRDVTKRANQIAANSDLPSSLVGLCIWVFDQIDPDDCEFFFDRLVDGQSLTKGDPIYELRRTLQGTKDVRGERSQTFLLAITIKAWNAYRNGDTVGLYRWRPGGSKPEGFPEPV